MAKRKARKRTTRRKSLYGLSGASFDAARINQQSIVDGMVKPVAIGLLGAAAGHFAGKGKNLLVALGGGLAAISMGYGAQATPFVIGAAVVTPPAAVTTTAGIDGIDGLKDYVAGGANRSKGFVKSLLSNAGVQSLADKIPVSGLGSLAGDDAQEIYDQGYMAGVGDLALLDDGDEASEINGGYLLAEGGAKPRSMTAAIAQSMI